MPEWIKDHPQYEVISAALRSESRHEKRWAAKVLEQFENQQTQYAGEHDDLCWYFLTFCCGYCVPRLRLVFLWLNHPTEKMLYDFAATSEAPFLALPVN